MFRTDTFCTDEDMIDYDSNEEKQQLNQIQELEEKEEKESDHSTERNKIISIPYENKTTKHTPRSVGGVSPTISVQLTSVLK